MAQNEQRIEDIENRECYMRSLPKSLCHINRKETLYEARAIACFLQEAIKGFALLGYEVNEDTAQGASICLDLLIDKIDIGSGSYLFPMSSIDKDAPEFCERRD